MLDVVDIRKGFGDVQALDGCSLSVPRGRMLGFLGPNEAGKTTVMRTVFGLVEADGGDALGRASDRPEERLRFGYMPEERGLYPRMPVGEQLAYFGTLHGLSGRAPRAPPRDGGCNGSASPGAPMRRSKSLSHGNQQRAQLAAALLHEPELLVLDEPFAGLDPVAVHMLVEVLRQEAARGAAVLFSSHQLGSSRTSAKTSRSSTTAASSRRET